MIKLNKINDLNIHPLSNFKNLNDAIDQDKNINLEQIKLFIKKFKKKNLFSKNIMIMNENFFLNKINTLNFKNFKKELFNVDFTYLVNFRKLKKTLNFLNDYKNIKRIKFHSYFQKIRDEDFNNIVKICKICEEKKISILIDASYGTLDMFKYDNLKLIIAISERVKKVPIVILHSGGANVIKAMMIALSVKNIFFETSFSLNFYENSNLWKDFNFAFKKIGYDKIIYGSDFPYVDIKDSEKNIKKFFKDFKLNDKIIDQIMYQNYYKV